MPGAWEVTDAGILFMAGPDATPDPSGAPDVLELYDFADHRTRTVGTLAFRVSPFGVNHFLTASRDGRWALASHVDRWDRNIFVVESFR
jgi:hypothetical protein